MGVIVIIFSTIETGIYCTICVSLAVLLFRTAKARGHFLGYVRVHSVVGDHLLDGSHRSITVDFDAGNGRRVWLPTSHHDGTNPYVKVHQPAPGIFVYRVSDGFSYPNANHYTDHLVKRIFETTRRTDPEVWETPGDRPWNDPSPTSAERRMLREQGPTTTPLPTLRAVILDFSAVNNVDVTSCQNLIDIRNQLDRWAAPSRVQWHFAHVNNKWTKRALAAAGFGSTSNNGTHKTKAIFDVAEIVNDGTSPVSSSPSQIFSPKEE
ncbi:hypothetical protein PENANT_c001G05701 [Penicillium antarcticum]|uniref:STAS domain-containing protein n=1 Tax=Penicillium antarcticum TaxID=416450 RepID=A0A1V6QNT6_9EURO|nr:hypothetical protein PENANT_c001G05701 [Penicillium antarcticum]